MRKVIVLQGISGSGKSSWANAQKARNPGATSIVSADEYFVKDGRYTFRPEFIGQAHRWCMRVFLHHLIAEQNQIIVDNTNTTLVEMAPYVAAAQAHDYAVSILRFECSISLALKRNVHQVPEKAISHQWADLVNCKLPPWWPPMELYNG